MRVAVAAALEKEVAEEEEEEEAQMELPSTTRGHGPRAKWRLLSTRSLN